MPDNEDVETPEVDESEGFDETRARAAIEKRNKENQSLRARLKELEPLAAKAREADEVAKTEAQKTAEARAQAEKERDEARLQLLKRDVAEEVGLPKAWADRLRGNTAEELEADAKELAKTLAPGTRPSATGRPVADLKSGVLPPGEAAATNADAWIRSRARR